MHPGSVQFSPFFAVFTLLALVCSAGRAEQLPIKVYTTADGLAHNHISQIRRDSRGFLWFCTDEGLTRFDGNQFVSYTTAQGLPHRIVNDLLETVAGDYWVASDAGICRLNPAAPPDDQTRPIFTVYQLGAGQAVNRVNALAEDSRGAVWCATQSGLFRLEQTAGKVSIQPTPIGLPRDTRDDPHVVSLLIDRHGTLWASAISGLYRRWPDGRTARYTKQHGLPVDFTTAMLERADGQLLVGTRYQGLCQVSYQPEQSGIRIERIYSTKDGLAGNDIRALFRSSDGRTWVAAEHGLSEFMTEVGQPPPSGRRSLFANYTAANGLSENRVRGLAEDVAGGLWMGTYKSGVMRLARPGFTTWTRTDGYEANDFNSICETQSGEICVYSISHRQGMLNTFGETRFKAIRPRLPTGIDDFGVGWQQALLQDRAGEWWLATGQGPIRYPRVRRAEQLAHTAPKGIYRIDVALSGFASRGCMKTCAATFGSLSQAP